jgi:small subunit ribosomal protein S6
MDDVVAPQSEPIEIPREERRRDYELAMILSTAQGEESQTAFLAKVRNAIAEEKGEVIEVTTPKTLTLAYPIRHERQGVFLTIIFRASSEVPERLLGELRHDPILLRYLIVERPKVLRSFSMPMPQRDTGEPTRSASELSPEAISTPPESPLHE